MAGAHSADTVSRLANTRAPSSSSRKSKSQAPARNPRLGLRSCAQARRKREKPNHKSSCQPAAATTISPGHAARTQHGGHTPQKHLVSPPPGSRWAWGRVLAEAVFNAIRVRRPPSLSSPLRHTLSLPRDDPFDDCHDKQQQRTARSSERTRTMVHPLLGKPAPAISLPAADGETYTLTPGAKGVPVALFFYPKSGTQLTRLPVYRYPRRRRIRGLCSRSR